jgi:hypothetical protein
LESPPQIHTVSSSILPGLENKDEVIKAIHKEEILENKL